MLGGVAIFFLLVSCWYVFLHAALFDAKLMNFTRQLIITIVPKSGEAFYRRLLNTAPSMPMKLFATTDTGVTLSRFSRDLSLISKGISNSFLGIIQLTYHRYEAPCGSVEHLCHIRYLYCPTHSDWCRLILGVSAVPCYSHRAILHPEVLRSNVEATPFLGSRSQFVALHAVYGNAVGCGNGQGVWPAIPPRGEE